MGRDLVRLLHVLFPQAREVSHHAAWRPPADVYRTRDGWLIKLDVAGVRTEDISVTAQGQTVTVRGRRRDWCRDEGCLCYQMEIAYTDFERLWTLPCTLDGATISAEHREGMLLIRIQTEEATP